MLAGVIPITAWRILTGGAPEIHGDGTQSRDFIFVRDTVDAVAKLYEVMPAGDSVNISTDGQISIADLIRRICADMGYHKELEQKPARHADVLCHNASNEKVGKLINYTLTPFDLGLAETLAWYKTHIKE